MAVVDQDTRSLLAFDIENGGVAAAAESSQSLLAFGGEAAATENSQSLPAIDVENGCEAEPAKILTVRGLTRDMILENVNMEVPRGVVVGVIGPSGAGKSTLLRAFNRLWEPPRGTVYLDGVDVIDIDIIALRRRVGLLFQTPVLFEGTVADNIRYGPSLRGKKLTDGEVEELLAIADLEPSMASRRGSDLSVGQAQRVALARTLANNPEVLMLDEPTSALDPVSTQNIEEAILRLKKARGVTTIMVSHSIQQIERITDIVCLVVGGTIVEVLDPGHLSDAHHPMARQFLQLAS